MFSIQMGLFVQEFPALLLSNDSDPGSYQINKIPYYCEKTSETNRSTTAGYGTVKRALMTSFENGSAHTCIHKLISKTQGLFVIIIFQIVFIC